MDQAIEAVEQKADVFLVGREGEDDGEVLWYAWDGLDVAGDHWRMCQSDWGASGGSQWARIRSGVRWW